MIIERIPTYQKGLKKGIQGAGFAPLNQGGAVRRTEGVLKEGS